jgi:hypothetical protein
MKNKQTVGFTNNLQTKMYSDFTISQYNDTMNDLVSILSILIINSNYVLRMNTTEHLNREYLHGATYPLIVIRKYSCHSIVIFHSMMLYC